MKAFELTIGTRLSLEERKSAFNVWWGLAKPTLPEDTDFDECLLLFLDAYDKARTPLGSNVLETAVKRLKETPPPPEANRFSSAKIKRLVHFCHELQTIAGGNPFFLGARDAARVIGCTPVVACKYLNGLVREGILELVVKGTAAGRRASRFRYAGPGHGQPVISGGVPEPPAPLGPAAPDPNPDPGKPT